MNQANASGGAPMLVNTSVAATAVPAAIPTRKAIRRRSSIKLVLGFIPIGVTAFDYHPRY